MTANIGFALAAAAISIVIVIGAAVKGDWWVAAVYALLVAGFLARAAYGRRARTERSAPSAPAGPDHEPERRLRRARFRRR